MEPEKKVVSLQQIYDQVQQWMDDAGIGKRSLHIEGTLKSYQHRKLGIYSDGIPDMHQEKEVRVYIGDNNYPSISCTHSSPSVVLETIRIELEKLKITRNPVDVVSDIEL